MKLFGRHFGFHTDFKKSMSGGKDFWILYHGFLVSLTLGIMLGMIGVLIYAFLFYPKIFATSAIMVVYWILLFGFYLWSYEKRADANHNFMTELKKEQDRMYQEARKAMEKKNEDNDGHGKKPTSV